MPYGAASGAQPLSGDALDSAPAVNYNASAAKGPRKKPFGHKDRESRHVAGRFAAGEKRAESAGAIAEISRDTLPGGGI